MYEVLQSIQLIYDKTVINVTTTIVYLIKYYSIRI